MKFWRKWLQRTMDKWSDSARALTWRLIAHQEPEKILEEVGDAKLQDTPATVVEEEKSMMFPVVRFWWVWALTVILLYFLRETFSILTLIFAAYIISVAMEWPIRFFKRLGTWRGRWMTFCYGGLAILILAILMVIPFVVIQMGELVSMLINVFQEMQISILELWWPWYIETRNFLPYAIKSNILESLQDPTFVASIQNQLNSFVGTWESWLNNLTVFAWKVTSWFAQTLWQVSLVVVLAIFFSIEKAWVLRFMVKSLSKNKGDVAYVHERVIAVYSKLQLRLKGQLFLMLYVGLLAYTGFWILHGFGIEIEKKELLALMAGVTEIVPYLGPLLGAIPALLVATLSHGLVWFVTVWIIFFIIQWTENSIIVPVVMNKVLGVSALLIFICILLWGWIFGIIWVLLAVPMAVIVAVLGDKNFGKE